LVRFLSGCEGGEGKKEVSDEELKAKQAAIDILKRDYSQLWDLLKELLDESFYSSVTMEDEWK
jgi:hypothetical protein